MTDDRENDPFSTGAGLHVLSRVSASAGEALIGRELGDYRITALIAEGGMSRVYRAERIDGSFERDVAIKVSPASGLSREFRERFLREQGMLAGLNHANVCQLYDAGVTGEGWPYIVMELVEGAPVDEWCRERAEDREAIVRLMIGIADALAYAHARLIVHRDIKPSNVLVNAEGRPKLLDFGIAKLLEPDVTAFTRVSPMTPRYASPEQLLGDEVTIGSDIYQLGLLYCEMLTGEALHPDQTVSDAIQRAAGRHAVSMPAAVRRRLPRELVLILEQCLRVAPEERYSDANALKRDLEAWLGGYPVSAAGQGAGYRLRKFVERNRPATLITAISAAAIIGGSLWYTYSLAEARALAERRAETSNRVLQAMSQLISETFSGLIDSNAERRVGSAVYVESVLEETVSLVRRELAAEPGARAELLRVQGTIEMVLGDAPAAAATLQEAYRLIDAAATPAAALQVLLDRVEAASRNSDVEVMRRMVDEATDLVAAHPFGPDLRARYHFQVGNVLQAEQEHEGAIAEFREAVRLLEESGTEDDRLLADAYDEMAYTYINWRRPEDAIESAQRAVEILEKGVGPMTHLLIHPLRRISFAQLGLNNMKAAREPIERAMTIARANFGELHSDVAAVHDTLGALAYRTRRFDDAIHHFEEYARIMLELEGAESKNLLVPYVNLGLMFTDSGRMDEAGRYHRLVLDAADPEQPETRQVRAVVLNNEGRRLFAVGDYDAAVDRYHEALGLYREIFDPDAFQIFDTQRNLALALLRAGRIDEARAEFRENVRLYGESRGFDSEYYESWKWAGWEFDLVAGDLDAAREKLEKDAQAKVERGDLDVIYWAELFGTLAAVCMQQGDMPCARQALDRAAIGTENAPGHPWAYFVQIVEAEYWQRMGNRERSRSLARSALEGLLEHYPLHEERIAQARALLDS